MNDVERTGMENRITELRNRRKGKLQDQYRYGWVKWKNDPESSKKG